MNKRWKYHDVGVRLAVHVFPTCLDEYIAGFDNPKSQADESFHVLKGSNLSGFNF